jgi:trans-aconitate methyltransferase
MKFEWNPNLYDDKHDFVFKFGEELLSLLNPQQDETILDIGCGTGDLTRKIQNLSKKVIGLDNSHEMILAAQKKYPEISFFEVDAKNFTFETLFDAVFSNAVLHWIPQPEKVIQNINRHLKIGGRFVAEFGGKGCNNSIISTLSQILDEFEIIHPKIEDSLYFPSIGDYSRLLEQNGFEVNFALLFDRPTELKGGLDGLNNFIEMFFSWLFVNVTEIDKSKIIELTNERLKPENFKTPSWIADYRRIRILAVKRKNV